VTRVAHRTTTSCAHAPHFAVRDEIPPCTVSKTTQGFKDRTDDFLAHQLKLEQEKLSSSTVQTTDAMLYLSRYAQRGIRIDGLSLINRPPNDAND